MNSNRSAGRKFQFWHLIVLPVVLVLARNESFLKKVLHSPGELSIAHFAERALVPFLLLLALGAFFYVLGRFAAVQCAKARFRSFWEELVFCLPIGLGLVSVAVLALGLAGWTGGRLYAGLCAAAGLLLAKTWKKRWAEAASAFRELKSRFVPFNAVEIVSVNIILWVLLHGLLLACVPPTDFDTLSYHLAKPLAYLREGKVFYQPGNMFGCLPANMEMIYMLGMALHGDVLARMTAWLLTALIPLAAALFGAEFFKSRSVGLLGAAIFSAQPVLTSFMGTAMQDAPLTLFVFLSLYALNAWRERREPSWLMVMGCLLGISLATKYQAIPFIAVACGLLLFYQLRDRRFSFSDWGGLLVPFALFAAPSLIRNAFWTGNPLWPLFPGLLGGKYLDLEKAQILAKTEVLVGQERTLAGWFRMAYRMVTELRFGNYYNPEYLTWPFLLTAIGVFFIRPEVPGPVILLAAFALLSSFPVHSIISFWRYLLPVLPGVCLVFSWSAHVFSKRTGKIFAAVLFLMLLAVARLDQDRELPPLFGLRSEPSSFADPVRSYLDSKLHYYQTYDFAIAHLPPDAKVMLYNVTDAYYLNRAYLNADPLFQGLIDYKNIHDAPRLAATLKEIGVTHILWDHTREFYIHKRDQELLPEWYHRSQRTMNRMKSAPRKPPTATRFNRPRRPRPKIKNEQAPVPRAKLSTHF